MANDSNDPFRRLDRHLKDEPPNSGLPAVQRFAPDKFYAWPLWKKLLFLAAIGLVVMGLATLQMIFGESRG